jgi:hypothetical protein
MYLHLFCSGIPKDVWVYDPKGFNDNERDVVEVVTSEGLRAMYSHIDAVPKLKPANNNSDYLQKDDFDLFDTVIICDGG